MAMHSCRVQKAPRDMLSQAFISRQIGLEGDEGHASRRLDLAFAWQGFHA